MNSKTNPNPSVGFQAGTCQSTGADLRNAAGNRIVSPPCVVCWKETKVKSENRKDPKAVVRLSLAKGLVDIVIYIFG